LATPRCSFILRGLSPPRRIFSLPTVSETFNENYIPLQPLLPLGSFCGDKFSLFNLLIFFLSALHIFSPMVLLVFFFTWESLSPALSEACRTGLPATPSPGVLLPSFYRPTILSSSPFSFLSFVLRHPLPPLLSPLPVIVLHLIIWLQGDPFSNYRSGKPIVPPPILTNRGGRGR